MLDLSLAWRKVRQETINKRLIGCVLQLVMKAIVRSWNVSIFFNFRVFSKTPVEIAHLRSASRSTPEGFSTSINAAALARWPSERRPSDLDRLIKVLQILQFRQRSFFTKSSQTQVFANRNPMHYPRGDISNARTYYIVRSALLGKQLSDLYLTSADMPHMFCFEEV